MQQHLPPDADRRPAVTLPVYVWAQLDEARREELLTRPAQTEAAAVTAAVTEIVEQVRRGGDPAKT